MTPGQQRALVELARVQAADPNGLEVLGKPREVSGSVVVGISIRMGPLQRREGGLALREREDFHLIIPPDFPFDYPSLLVDHTRFAGFPHVGWSTYLCLYQSKLEWNPADGLFGFFDRLALWLARAARNEMDPIEGPLEPPHFITDTSQQPIVVRSNAPAAAGNRWLGWALLNKLPNRIELTGWNEISDPVPNEQAKALAIILSEPLPMEFPERGKDLFRELLKCGIGRNALLGLLALAATATPDDEPAYLVIGLPMRRAADGSLRLHIAVWATESNYASSLRRTVPEVSDSEALRDLRQDLADSIYALFEVTTIKWCPVLEDRDEIVIRRDSRTPVAWFRDKAILVLGCGALGSWAAEMIARAKPAKVDLVDNAIVKPGILARQNFILDDIGSDKPTALARRLQSLVPNVRIQGFPAEAHRFLRKNIDGLAQYDLVLDCTASSITQMKLERDWTLVGVRLQRLVAFVIDATAQRLLAVSLAPQSDEGPWSAYVRLKYELCSDNPRSNLATSFYSPRSLDALFQPEPGCSDPTFAGSTADVSRLAATALNLITDNFPESTEIKAIACELPARVDAPGTLEIMTLPPAVVVSTGSHRVSISRKVFNQARASVRQNARRRSPAHETGGLLWGYWDDSTGTILIHDASGPPPDSQHDPGHFICGVEGTSAEHEFRSTTSYGTCGFIGLWHTHPDLPPQQSQEDVLGMTGLVAGVGQNRRRSLMLIFGRTAGQAAVGVYVYEAQHAAGGVEYLQVGVTSIPLENPVV